MTDNLNNILAISSENQKIIDSFNKVNAQIDTVYKKVSSSYSKTVNELASIGTKINNAKTKINKASEDISTKSKELWTTFSKGKTQSEELWGTFSKGKNKGKELWDSLSRINSNGKTVVENFSDVKNKGEALWGTFVEAKEKGDVLWNTFLEGKEKSKALKNSLKSVWKALSGKKTNPFDTIQKSIGKLKKTVKAAKLRQAFKKMFSGNFNSLWEALKKTSVWTKTVSAATKIWSAIQWVLNAAMAPIIAIPLIIIGIGAAIAWVVSKTEGWGEAWKHTVNGAKHLFMAYVGSIKLAFSTVINGFMIGIDKIKLGWYKFKKAMGMGDALQNDKMIASINADTEKRKQAIKESADKVKEALKKSKEAFVKAGGSIKIKKETESTQGEKLKKTGLLSRFSLGKGVKTQQEENKVIHTGKRTNKSIATGGARQNSITINLKDLIGVLNIKGNDFKDSAKQMQEQSADALLRTLALATTAGN